MRPNKHVHTPDDGRGKRRVFVDGVQVLRAVYADTKRGIVRVLKEPIEFDKRKKRPLTFTLRGKVQVEPM